MDYLNIFMGVFFYFVCHDSFGNSCPYKVTSELGSLVYLLAEVNEIVRGYQVARNCTSERLTYQKMSFLDVKKE